jgi:DNA primase
VAKEDTAEVLSIDGRDVRVSNPDKLYFSKQTKVTKLELVRYYLAVAPGALAGIRDRPIVLKRFVDGAEGVLSEACAHEPAGVVANRDVVVSFGARCGGGCS